jgi:hypothetical protein
MYYLYIPLFISAYISVSVKTADTQSSDNVGIIGGSISGVALVIIVSVLLAVFFLKRR